jgi:hypothetical protein
MTGEVRGWGGPVDATLVDLEQELVLLVEGPYDGPGGWGRGGGGGVEVPDAASGGRHRPGQWRCEGNGEKVS